MFDSSSTDAIEDAEIEQEALDAVVADHIGTKCTVCRDACTDDTTDLRGLCSAALLEAQPHLTIMRQQN